MVAVNASPVVGFQVNTGLEQLFHRLLNYETNIMGGGSSKENKFIKYDDNKKDVTNMALSILLSTIKQSNTALK